MSSTTARPVGVLSLVTVAVMAGLVLMGLPSGAHTDVDITIRDYRFHPATITVPADEPLTLTFINEDEVGHDVTFGRQVELEEGRPAGYAEDLLAGLEFDIEPRAALSRDADNHTMLTVAPGSAVTLRVVLPTSRTGAWEMGCFQTAGCHYIAGLHGEVLVR